jgi:hypothetical protein
MQNMKLEGSNWDFPYLLYGVIEKHFLISILILNLLIIILKTI